ncbi:2-oxoglutarate dehydrogenase complex dihydrolipoyllysine-residue succinyltransferase [Oligoflexus tunisiensis]|uniref:2-oxoglutarate dehydrogenase complex dihydrolipoyllysine-residue succinyltransferase n=1 Tax=Oligoflexus tunisiensis TaxID=708132 RepID=UPI000AB50F4E|nr:2-oxoglutarate dehydrogenase complex dihydrolipoyllysine-residue succinyltransferase [Oligoflexus tunisiensis]
MAFEVRFPVVGESVQEGQVYKWRKKTGEFVKRDEVLVEVETDKATVEIVAEAEGTLTVQKNEGETIAVGELLASIDTSAKAPAAAAPAAPAAAPKAAAPAVPPPPAPKAAPGGDSRPQSPAVARMAAEHQVDTAAIAGSGRGGRVTKDDMVAHLESPKPAAPAAAAAPKAPAPLPAAPSGARTERREKMSRLRQRIAERLVEAQHTAAMLTTFNEVDMSGVMELRKRYKDPFKEVHGVGLGFMSFFVKAAVQALKQFPAINGYVDGTDIVYHDYYDIGVAVSTERGLMVPVVRDVDKLSFAQIEGAIADYAKKGREGKISLDDLTGGTFTISNGGTFGSLLSTPILNPPQSAILGMHKIEERPVVVNGQIVIRPMMYLAMSYDHRIVDGKEAVGFLVKIKENIEDPARLLLGV